MKRKNLMTALICAICLATVPMAGCGEDKTTEKNAAETKETEEAVEDAEETENVETETTTETTETDADNEAVAENETVFVERPAYVASDYVELGEYKGLAVEVTKDEVTDEEVEARFELNVGNFGTDIMDVLTEGTVQEGDIANIDYEGKKDGVAFEGGTAEGHDLEIGSGSFIDGFEDGLIGAEIGATVDLELTFPENYQAADLAGQDVVFTVTVNEVKRMPEEITDELIEIGTDGKYKTIDEYKEYVRSILEENAAEARESMILASLINQVAANATVNGYPQDLVDYCAASMKEYYAQTAAMYGMELEAFLEAAMAMTLEDFEAQIQVSVQQSLVQELSLAAVAEAEGMEISDEEYQEGVSKYMTMYGFTDEEEFIKTIGGENVVRLNLIQKKVTDFLIQNAVINEVEAEEATEAVSEETVEEVAEEVSEEAVEETAEEVNEEAVEETTEEVSEEAVEETAE